jgi:hypothetical protein
VAAGDEIIVLDVVVAGMDFLGIYSLRTGCTGGFTLIPFSKFIDTEVV